MPELPEVETVVRGLIPVWEGQEFASVMVQRGDLRLALPSDFSTSLEGQVIGHLGRRGKYLLVQMKSGLILLGHLGMSGRLTIHRDSYPELGKHDHIRFKTTQGVVVDYHDPRRFGGFALMDQSDLETHPLLAAMGPEPLSHYFSAQFLHQKLAHRRSPIKTALLDQTLVAGLGNIYVCESLFMAGIAPTRLACSLVEPEVMRLYESIVAVLHLAIAAGGSSLRDYRQADGNLGYFQHSFAVYGREGEFCPCCDCLEKYGSKEKDQKGILRIIQGGRSSFYCPRKQI